MCELRRDGETFDKMLVFLLLMLSIQQAQTCKGNPINRRTDLEDCTRTFRNRTASFESGRYPNYWMYPSKASAPYSPAIYSTSTANVKEDKTYHWYLHDCGSGKVCLETKSEGWENYYIQYQTGHTYITRDTNFYDGSNESKEMEIWCTSCTPEEDNLTYSDCQIHTSKVDPKMSLHLLKNGDVGGFTKFAEEKYVQGPSRIKWRILSPPTRQYWETTVAADNCGGQVDLRAAHTVTSSITRTESTTQTTTVSAKISLGLEAAKILKLLGGEAGISHSWSTTSTTEAAEGKSTTLGGSLGHVVKPGYKWIVKQLVGEAGYTKIKSLHFTAKDVKCT